MVLSLSLLPACLALAAAGIGLAVAQSDIPLSQNLQKILSNAQSGSLYTYPTDLTQGIIPKNLHSHNDYWRPQPFYSALSVGAISVEADVWLYNGTLHVGHEESALTAARTLDSLYIQPILSVLRAQNPNSSYVTGDAPTKNGVFDASSGQTLYLFVDMKTSGEDTFPAVVQALEPLRAAGYLTTFNGTSTTTGPVTVIGTGNTPLNLVTAQQPRDVFYDAPLAALSTTAQNITSDISPIASTAFSGQFGTVRNGTLNSTMLEKLDGQISVATERGIGTRYWDQPNWPVSNRDAIWRLLWSRGVTLINVDDLEGAANL